MARDSWRSSELIPRPDPSKLTTEAVERATALYRSELVGAQKLFDQQITALDRFLNRRLDDAEKAVQAALASADKAVTKAETAADKRFEGLNEFRMALQDQTNTYMPRTEYENAHKAVVDRLAVNGDRIAALELRLTSRLDSAEGVDSGSAYRVKETRENMVLGVMALTMIISVVAILVSVFLHVH